MSLSGLSGLSGLSSVLGGVQANLNQGFVDFQGPANGTTCTTANLNACIRGGVTSGVGWLTQGTGAAMKFATAANKPLTNSVGPLFDGTTIAAGAGTLGVQYLTASDNSYLRWDLNGENGAIDSDDFSAGIWIFCDLPNTDLSNMDVFTVFAPSGLNFCNVKWLIAPVGTTRCFQLEVGGGGGNSHIEVATSTWYWLSLRYRKTGNHELRVYNAASALVGTIQEVSNGVGRASYVALGQSSSNTPTTGFVINFDSLKVSFDGTYPLLP